MAFDSEVSSWASVPLNRRCQVVAAAAGKLAEATDELTLLCQSDQRTDPVETITAELLPLCSALRWLGRRGPRVLATRQLGPMGRPAWLWGVRSAVHRDPFGMVLILGAWNYPLLLPGVQAAQALAAGNRVLIKPAPGCESATARMVQAFHDAGIPPTALMQLDSSSDSAIAAINAGVDLIVLTGAATTGRNVLAQAARSLTPTIMELSGCDATILLPGADVQLAADAITFGLKFNGGATCIAPRRLIGQNEICDQVRTALVERLGSADPLVVHPSAREAAADLIERSLAAGCVDVTGRFHAQTLRDSGQMAPTVLDQVCADHPIASADVFAPVTSIVRVADTEESIQQVNQCPYRLSASVFGPPKQAEAVAQRLSVGNVCINDILVPTADPRLPFGGRGQSGFGVTRGAEGLLSMTVPKSISHRRGRFMPHLRPRADSDENRLSAAVILLHGATWSQRWQALRRMGR
ncbi:Betaine aldehyde dehydrogenase [Rubripirellula lacrimiformis]|uniref:Betaine aldehyde dehydrogenase n=1 Tax=Rubripirellula lacrimiformis TaxID=1930273 RepID=A0A517NBZ7_9BACT|nr:aldehyde dehydrogenase family protein [Rubripirellula lacrimiformis]QDT04664.1 Betaine aldehyde dehydrogenase [Rubripirellula lacrimiformis]